MEGHGRRVSSGVTGKALEILCSEIKSALRSYWSGAVFDARVFDLETPVVLVEREGWSFRYSIAPAQLSRYRTMGGSEGLAAKLLAAVIADAADRDWLASNPSPDSPGKRRAD